MTDELKIGDTAFIINRQDNSLEFIQVIIENINDNNLEKYTVSEFFSGDWEEYEVEEIFSKEDAISKFNLWISQQGELTR